MFFREKRAGSRTYLQIVENRWEEGGSRQRVMATIGRIEELRESGELDSLLASGARFSQTAIALDAHSKGEAPTVNSSRIGPSLVFGRLWEETGIGPILRSLLEKRRYDFPVERAVFLTVLHRLVDPGSDRAADKWRHDYQIDGVDVLELHHLYRAMGWLGEELSEEEQEGRLPFGSRCTKDIVEERLFARRRDLFTSLSLVFFDTTSIYFEGEGGETLGEYGHSKDHRPDLKQMVVGLVLDGEGLPVCCEMWPGNTTDVTTLIPVVDRLRQRFSIGQVCVVADRGMISEETIAALEGEPRKWLYILGARMRAQKEVRDEVLWRGGGRYRQVHPPRETSKDPSPLEVKEVRVKERRYIVCFNEEQAKKDRADRKAILTALRKQLRKGDKSLVGNKGYRKFIKSEGESFRIDRQKVHEEARYDGKWVLRTNTDWDAAKVALHYKQLWTVEDMFRTAKSLLATRPIFHKCDETIRGHVFCSFLALALRKELQGRLSAKGYEKLEWADVIRDLKELTITQVSHEGKQFLLRSQTKGTCGKVFQAAGVALPPTVRLASRASP